MLYQRRFRIESARLPNWNYRSPGWYFITVTTQNRQSMPFGYIQNGFMCLNALGAVAHTEWYQTSKLRKNVIMDTFIVMPDHVHGIIQITCNCYGVPVHSVETHCNASLPQMYQRNSFGPQRQNIPSIVRGFKSAVTRFANQNGFADFKWQPRYYDRIIRSQQELHQVRKYIIDNPKKW